MGFCALRSVNRTEIYDLAYVFCQSGYTFTILGHQNESFWLLNLFLRHLLGYLWLPRGALCDHDILSDTCSILGPLLRALEVHWKPKSTIFSGLTTGWWDIFFSPCQLGLCVVGWVRGQDPVSGILGRVQTICTDVHGHKQTE